jgi:hypothetical protein
MPAQIMSEYDIRKEKERREELSPKLEQKAQQVEILLSNDFENMALEKIKFVKTELDQLWGYEPGRKDDEILYLTNAQRLSRDFMDYMITKLEHKADKVKPGDLFYTHWGYEQTNTEMYKVISITKSGKSAKVRQIGMKTKEGSEGFMSDSVQPDPDFEIKVKKWDENLHQNIDTPDHLPDLTVRINRSSSFHPYNRTHDDIGKIHLRGSVYYAGDSKHLQNLYPIEKDGSTYRSWYA